MVQLVSNLQIFDPESIDISGVSGYLLDHPALIDDWEKWSANKRTSSGCYFSGQPGGYVVGYHPKGETLRFSERQRACAEFIRRELRALLDIAARRSSPN
jgi:hypothetical protein